jgi:hypothetical protein
MARAETPGRCGITGSPPTDDRPLTDLPPPAKSGLMRPLSWSEVPDPARAVPFALAQPAVRVADTRMTALGHLADRSDGFGVLRLLTGQDDAGRPLRAATATQADGSLL